MEQHAPEEGALDRIFDALGDPFRRRILTILFEANPRDESEFPVDDLVVDEDDTELTTVIHYHQHLPRLAEAGYIEWDRDTHTVRRGPRFDEVAPLIRLMRDHEDELPAEWP